MFYPFVGGANVLRIHYMLREDNLLKPQNSYWFLQYDFPDIHGLPYRTSGGNMEWNDSIQKEIPQGWKVSFLDNCGEFKNGINYEKSDKGSTHVKTIVTHQVYYF